MGTSQMQPAPKKKPLAWEKKVTAKATPVKLPKTGIEYPYLA